uniref:Putative polyprotein n=1 Tax=Albugo laibachii Nc14 TaxID=890382 RepID=F0WSF8_9STRA|nr:putative polyprotein [Albugo laibachii Nc14]|eukprot:CCA24279.1 putative polyprotein [Albugo laibachii Nc14]
MNLSQLLSPAIEADSAEMNVRPCRSLIECLKLNTTFTSPDIACVVTLLSCFLETPGTQHWKAAIRVLRYLWSTRENGMVLCTKEVLVRSLLKRLRTLSAEAAPMIDVLFSGVMVMIGHAPVVSKSMYQRIVS